MSKPWRSLPIYHPCRSMEKRQHRNRGLEGPWREEHGLLVELCSSPPRNVGEVVEVVSLLLDARSIRRGHNPASCFQIICLRSQHIRRIENNDRRQKDDRMNSTEKKDHFQA